MQPGDETTLRSSIEQMLGDGLKTQVDPFPQDDREFAQILGELRTLEPGDVKGKLMLAGFMDKPYGPDNMRCQECMYFLIHRRWCDLPELALPVEPNWWCRLWRI